MFNSHVNVYQKVTIINHDFPTINGYFPTINGYFPRVNSCSYCTLLIIQGLIKLLDDKQSSQCNNDILGIKLQHIIENRLTNHVHYICQRSNLSVRNACLPPIHQPCSVRLLTISQPFSQFFTNHFQQCPNYLLNIFSNHVLSVESLNHLAVYHSPSNSPPWNPWRFRPG